MTISSIPATGRVPIIGLRGKARSGKDSVAAALVAAAGGERIAFAAKLKQICQDLFDLTDAQMHDEKCKTEPTRFRRLACPMCQTIAVSSMPGRPPKMACDGCNLVGDQAAFDIPWTPRDILQYVGTEGLRRVDQDVWVRHALKLARERLIDGSPLVVITDCRFDNEMAAILAAGGEVWRVRRPATDGDGVGIPGHASEAEMDATPDSAYARVIVNDADLATLQARARVALGQSFPAG